MHFSIEFFDLTIPILALHTFFTLKLVPLGIKPHAMHPNDIMNIKREVADKFMAEGIYKFILIAENVLNFHSGDKDYYEEWTEETGEQNGWVICINMPEQTQYDFRRAKLDRYIGLMEQPDWRIYKPFHLFKLVSSLQERRLNSQ